MVSKLTALTHFKVKVCCFINYYYYTKGGEKGFFQNFTLSRNLEIFISKEVKNKLNDISSTHAAPSMDNSSTLDYNLEKFPYYY